MAISKLIVVVIGDDYSVLMTEEVYTEFCALDARKRARLDTQMRQFASHKKKIKEEGRHPTPLKEIAIFAFGDSTTQNRLYGAYTHDMRPKSFTCVSCVVKKRTKARPGDLKLAADLIHKILVNHPEIEEIEND